MMEALGVGEMYGTNSNIATRADSVQISNEKANLYWYTETIYSKNRDLTLYPTPTKYVVPLSRTYKRVLEVELLTAQVPISSYVVDCADAYLKTPGNNCFCFGEGYIIDNGSLYGICNDSVMVREYSNPASLPFQQQCEIECHVSRAFLPRTLTEIQSIRKGRDWAQGSQSSQGRSQGGSQGSQQSQGGSQRSQASQQSQGGSQASQGSQGSQRSQQAVGEEDWVTVTTVTDHNFTQKWTPCVQLVDSRTKFNGKATVKKIINCRTFLAQLEQGTHESSSQSSQSQSSASGGQEGSCGGWVVLPRVESPHKLAEMVQDYLNQCAEPPIQNAYSITFNDAVGRFIFTRASGQYLFDLLAGTDEQSVFSTTMGFSATDYMYGQYSLVNQRQSRLPSDIMMDTSRPDIASQSCGEAALACISRGNYVPEKLGKAITSEMQRPIIAKGENDTLVAQLLGQEVTIIVPPGMYDPQNLVNAICARMTAAYNLLSRQFHERSMSSSSTSGSSSSSSSSSSSNSSQRSDQRRGAEPALGGTHFRGSYHLGDGAFCIESMDGEKFGLLFSQSTIGDLLGFDAIDFTGHTSYTSMCSVFFPITNRRFTDQIYNVSAQNNDLTFRFTKTGAYQAPIVRVKRQGENSVRVYTWICSDDEDEDDNKCVGQGKAHGFQVGDVMTIEGVGDTKTSPPIVGTHIVKKVFDAYSFELALSLDDDSHSSQSSSSSSQSTKGDHVSSSTKGDHVSSKGDSGKRDFYVATHAFQPFSLVFAGLESSIGKVLGFSGKSFSGCIDYVSPFQWNLYPRQEVFLNIEQLTDSDYGRICKTSDSSAISKYSYRTANSFVRIPISGLAQGLEFGLLSSSSFTRRKRFTMNSINMYEVAISIVDECDNLVPMYGRDHSFDIRILTEC